MEESASRLGFGSLSEYVRHLHTRVKAGESDHAQKRTTLAERHNWGKMGIHHQTDLGAILHGDALCYLFNGTGEKSVDLIMTSPPFGLVRKKSYGNEDAHRYCEWFRPFAEGFLSWSREIGQAVKVYSAV